MDSHPSQDLRQLQANDHSPLFEPIDLQIADLAAKYLPADLCGNLVQFAKLIFAECHRQSTEGHFLFKTREIFSNQQEWGIQIGSKLDLKRLFSELDENFHTSRGNPIFWDTQETMYLRKFWMIEKETSRMIANYANRSNGDALENSILRTLPITLNDQQQLAAVAPLKNPFVLISGGPGTGKTYTVVQTIRILKKHDPNTKIQLLAPTGKAVARIQESIRQNLSTANENGSSVLENVAASTIHRFLQTNQSASRKRPYPQPRPELNYIIIDEASMVDLPILHQLLSSIDPRVHLILMGDVNQLASVQPGAAFADTFQVCQETNHKIPAVQLVQQFRFKDNPTLGDLCHSIQNGNASEAIQILKRKNDQLSWCDSENPATINTIITDWVKTRILKNVPVSDGKKAIEAFSESMILCTQNEGPFGVNKLNQSISKACDYAFSNLGNEQRPTSYWKPIIIRKNDYSLGLFNGDIGVIQQSPIHGKSISDSETSHDAWFETVDGNLNKIPAYLLPEHTSAYATTIHKAQGSEADHVLLIMPNQINRLLTRELIYTAVSRAKKTLTIVSSEEAFVHCIKNPTQRESGLRNRIRELVEND